jgi:hypothetical protein
VLAERAGVQASETNSVEERMVMHKNIVNKQHASHRLTESLPDTAAPHAGEASSQSVRGSRRPSKEGGSLLRMAETLGDAQKAGAEHDPNSACLAASLASRRSPSVARGAERMLPRPTHLTRMMTSPHLRPTTDAQLAREGAYAYASPAAAAVETAVDRLREQMRQEVRAVADLVRERTQATERSVGELMSEVGSMRQQIDALVAALLPKAPEG